MLPRILILDAFNIMISQNSVVNITNSNAEPIGMYISTINMIKSLIDRLHPTQVYFVLDGPNAGERRRKLYPDYKNKRKVSSRSSSVKLHLEDGEVDKYSEQDWFQNQMLQIYEFLKLLPVYTIVIPYCEADDVITYLTKRNDKDFEIIISSTDKDYYQHISKNVSIYNWRTKKIIDVDVFKEEHSIIPENYIYKKVMLGDTVDNIKNIQEHLGPKTFNKLFSEYLNTEKLQSLEDFFNIIDNYDLQLLTKPNQKKILDLREQKEARKSIIKSYKLMKLDEYCLKQHHIEILRKQIEEQSDKKLSRISAKVTMMKDGFNKLYGTNAKSFNIDRWLQPFNFLNRTDDQLTI